ncbi:MAG: amidase, Asp-tRNAAsn/Glu-tRNAGln amidotransferase subunit [Ilumatobacteraceae bacterium]|nr:amidase, Asp-tRNAAsn/Glu-tRNAGln amidotransferase subunit [Ilumatobacteraceae bacterium]
MSDIAALDATAQAALVRSGEASPAELVEGAVERAKQVNGQLNAIIHPRYEDAVAEAGGDLPDGPFRGVPFLLKDLDGTAAGEPLHAGTRFLKEAGYIADTDSELTVRFRDAGLVVIGRTNTPELGLVTTTEPEAYGASHNPWDLDRSTGGSSGGSAACVAAGIVPMAHAGDGGGSIRIPASECGLVGLKPTRGRSTLGPEVGEAWAGLVTRLAVTRSVRDTAALLDAVAGPGVGDPYWAPPPARPYVDELAAEPGSLRIGWTNRSFDGSIELDPQVAAATEATANLLEQLGHQVIEASPAALASGDTLEYFLPAYSAWVARELDHLAEMAGVPLREDGFEAGTWAIAEAGRATTAQQYLAALDGLHRLTRATVAWWEVEGFDLLLTPTLPELPPTLGQFGTTKEEPLNGLFRSAVPAHFTAPFNVTGQPGISLPLHQSEEGLPIGMQLVAAPAREDLLIRIAAQLETAHPWADRRPLIWTGTI